MHDYFDCYGIGRLYASPNYWKNQKRLLTSLQVIGTYENHNGCVNAIKWDASGRYILSGSDDRCVALTDPFGPHPLLFKRQLRAKSNVFSVTFFPSTDTDEIFAGFRCGCVINARIDRFASDLYGGKLLFSHKMPVYGIITLPDQSHCFLTLSHDRTVRVWDNRLPHQLGQDSQLCGRSCFYSDIHTISNVSCRLSEAVPKLSFDFPVTAGDVHPLDGSRAVAIASSDGFVRLFDLRCLHQDDAGRVTPKPYKVVRPLNLSSQVSKFRREIRLDYGPLFITSVRFEPPPSSVHGASIMPHKLFKSARLSNNGLRSQTFGSRRLLVNHMYSPAFLFDLNDCEVGVEDKATTSMEINRLQDDHSDGAQPAGDTPVSRSTPPAENFHPNMLMAMLLVRLMDRWHTTQFTSQNQPSIEASTSTTVSNTNNSANNPSTEGDSSQANSGIRAFISNSSLSEENSSMFDLISEETVNQILSEIPRARQLAFYCGQKSIRTVIKDACFWGDDYIMSGSECGNVLVWDRHTREPVSAIKADEVVVNRLEPHPHLPYMAVSGVDHSIKLLQPKSTTETNIDENDQSFSIVAEKQRLAACSISAQNRTRTQEALDSGAALTHQFASFRIGRAARNFLRRRANEQQGGNS